MVGEDNRAICASCAIRRRRRCKPDPLRSEMDERNVEIVDLTAVIDAQESEADPKG